MKKDSKKDSGVSPVIGTILLVAITVVLVAIISAVVMGMSGDVDSAHVVGLKVSADSVTITGGDLAGLSTISGAGITTTNAPFSVGQIIAVTGSVGQIIGTFSDGSKQILYSP